MGLLNSPSMTQATKPSARNIASEPYAGHRPQLLEKPVVDREYFTDRYGLVLTRIGRVSEGEGVWLEDGAGTIRRAEGGGFDHWREVGA